MPDCGANARPEAVRTGAAHALPEVAQTPQPEAEWSYEIHGTNISFDEETNQKIEMAYGKDEDFVQVYLRDHGEFVIDLATKIGYGWLSGEQITVTRKWTDTTTTTTSSSSTTASYNGSVVEIHLPEHWTPMPRDNTVHTVQLEQGSPEYQDVLRKVQASTGGQRVHIEKIERVQNPILYQSYMLRKLKMDNDNGGNSERELFHGTTGQSIGHINTQGFNRSFTRQYHGLEGRFGPILGGPLGRGVYFAREASCSVRLMRRRQSSGGTRGDPHYLYLARVLVGQYCAGNCSLTVPPPKDPSRPEVLYDSVVDQVQNPNMFAVFFDNQCYPEYLITFT